MGKRKRLNKNAAEQGSLDWHRERLGIFTSSKIDDLIGKIKRDKDGIIIVPDLTAKTALNYIYKKASERLLKNELVADDDMFSQYLLANGINTKSIQWGKDNEPYARKRYANKTKYKVEEYGLQKFILDGKVLFGDSPDGVIEIKKTKERGTCEIKCPDSSTHIQYCEMKDEFDLLAIEQDYYIQCQGHIMANDADWCDFISYDPRLQRDYHCIRVYPNKPIQELMITVLRNANNMLEEIVKAG